MSFFDEIDISKLPSKIKNNNLLGAIIEIRFDEISSAEEIVWSLFSEIKDSFSSPIKQPIAEMPREIRARDESLKKCILYTIDSNDKIYRIGCGDGIITLEISSFKYTTWNDFYLKFSDIFDKVCGFIKQIERVGVRYINVFNNSNYNDFKIDLNIDDKSLEEDALQLVFNCNVNDRVVKINFLNKAQYYVGEETYNDAIILDIDAIYVKKIDKKEIKGIINGNHSVVKKVFFGMCKEDFIRGVLKPCKGEE